MTELPGSPVEVMEEERKRTMCSITYRVTFESPMSHFHLPVIAENLITCRSQVQERLESIVFQLDVSVSL